MFCNHVKKNVEDLQHFIARYLYNKMRLRHTHTSFSIILFAFLCTDLENYEKTGEKVCQWTAQESLLDDVFGKAAAAEPESLRTFGWGSTWPS